MPDMPNIPNTPRGRQMITGQGSGFFISADGYAVTNFHVVDHAKTVQIQTDSGKTYTAKVVGTDQKTDLALIKVDADKSFPFVTFAEQAPRVGDWVIAVGNPFGLSGTATAGIVSARGRDIGAGPYDDFIQIDAPINKGNSGGPAFNVEGKVIAVNTAIYSPSGGSVGIGFGIPADTVKTVVAQLKDKGYVERGWIGVKVQAVTEGIADSLGMKKAEGAIVAEAQSGAPAAKAGVQSGDVITAVNGDAVKDFRDLAKKIGAMAPGATVKLSVRRKGEQKTLTLTLAQDAEGAAAGECRDRHAAGLRRHHSAAWTDCHAGEGRGWGGFKGRRGHRRQSRQRRRRARGANRRRDPRCRRQGSVECLGGEEGGERSAARWQAFVLMRVQAATMPASSRYRSVTPDVRHITSKETFARNRRSPRAKETPGDGP